MKFLAYLLYIFGSLCEFAGVFIIIDNVMAHLRHQPLKLDLDWPLGVLLCLLGAANVIAFKLLQRRCFPPQDK